MCTPEFAAAIAQRPFRASLSKVSTHLQNTRTLFPAVALVGLAIFIVWPGSDAPLETASDVTTTTTSAAPTTSAPQAIAAVETTATTAVAVGTSAITSIHAPVAFGQVDDKEFAQAETQLYDAKIVGEFTAGSDYDRDSYTGGGWPDSDGDCQSDRHEILIDESLVEPVLDDAGCRVESGLWIDAYDGTVYTNAELVTIDHFVPLATAHRAGAWEWDSDSKRAFASDIEFAATHVAVGADINQAKGDKGPDAWRPPKKDSWCRYAVDWISVKNRWSLAFTDAETLALEEMLTTCEPVVSINGIASATDDAPASPTITSTTSTSTSTSTTTTASTTTSVATTTAVPEGDCHPNYKPCITNLPGDALNCADVRRQVQVIDADPYQLDGNDNDGLGCESYR